MYSLSLLEKTPMTLNESVSTKDDASSGPQFHSDACMEALSRVLASQTFSKSARLPSLLRYVCTASLEGRAALLNEQTIGNEVFGRQEHYNPAEDTIVRTTARLLRQRLIKYYETEGFLDRLRIAIPRGAYVPVFVHTVSASSSEHCLGVPAAESDADIAGRPLATEKNDKANAVDHDSAHVSKFRQRLHAVASWFRTQNTVLRSAVILGAGASLTIVIALSVFTIGRTLQSPADVFWASLFTTDRDLLLVPADSGLVMYQGEIHRQLALEEYIAKKPDADGALANSGAKFRWRPYTATSSLELAIELGNMKNVAHERFHMRSAPDLKLDDLKHSNAILVGIRDSNPWVELFRNRLNFHIDWEPVSGKELIRNDRPLTGEQVLYDHSKDDPQKRGFAQIAYTRNLSGDGHVLLVGGTSSAGTGAAIDFLFNPDRMRAILKRAVLPDGSVGEFEILLQCVLQAGGSTEIKILGIRDKSKTSGAESPSISGRAS